jgi:hypothetical protein
MTSGESSFALAKRILSEKRAIVWPLAIALLVNAGAYAFVIYPLSARSAGARNRAETAAASRRAAESEEAAARALVVGKTRADEELTAFYHKVLPADLSAARRLTYARLPAIARKVNVQYESARTEIESSERQGPFGRLRTTMVLQGDYENIRRFVYEVETAPEFVILDAVLLAQAEVNKPLMLTLQLSTYYRLGDHGA